VNHYTEINLLKLVEEILNLDTAMRFVAVIDLKGNILEAIMKEKKTSLESQKQQEKFCKDSAKARHMREYYDDSLGKTRYAHVERENVTQIYVYPKKSTIFVTMEPELSIDKKMEIITKIKKLATNL
jgi:GH18 family chitinase